MDEESFSDTADMIVRRIVEQGFQLLRSDLISDGAQPSTSHQEPAVSREPDASHDAFEPDAPLASGTETGRAAPLCNNENDQPTVSNEEDDFGDFSEAVQGDVTLVVDAEAIINRIFKAEPLPEISASSDKMEDIEFMDMWKKILGDSIYSKDKYLFKFETSDTRRMLYEALDIPLQPSEDEVSNKNSCPTVLRDGQSGNLPSGKIDRVVERVSELCQVPLDELKTKSNFEIRKMIEILALSLKSLKAEFNGLLETNERLEMEADVQNRLISCLIQNAMK